MDVMEHAADQISGRDYSVIPSAGVSSLLVRTRLMYG